MIASTRLTRTCLARHPFGRLPAPVLINRLLGAIRRSALTVALTVATAAVVSGLLPASTAAQQTEASALTVYNEAKALYDQGRYAEALPQAERALTLALLQLPENDARIATMHGLLGALYITAGRYTDAETAYLQALKIRGARWGRTDPRLGDTWHYIGVARQYAGRFADAEQAYRDGLDLRQRRYGAEAEAVAESLTRLGLSVQQQDRYREAEPPLLRALEIRRNARNLDPASIQESLGHLLALYVESGRLRRAEPVLRDLIAAQKKRVGVEHPSVARWTEQLAIVLQRLNRFDEAETLYREALAIREAIHGPHSKEVALSLYNIGALYGRMADAEPLYSRALAIQETVLPADDPQLVPTRLGLGRVMLEQSRFDEALPLLQAAADAKTRREGSRNPDMAPILKDIAQAQQGLGRSGEAVESLRAAQSLEEQAGRTLARANTLADLAAVELDAGRTEPALRAQQEAVALFRGAAGADTVDTAREISHLGVIHGRLGDHAAAVPLQREALEIRTKRLGSVHPDVARSRLRLAQALLGAGRAAEAEGQFARALKVAEILYGDQSPRLRSLLNGMVSALTALGRPAEARPYQLRIEALPR